MQQSVVQFSPDQLALIRQTVAKGTNEAEFRLFIEVCHYHQLNPFARQIYAVVREGYQGRQLTIQTSIDGYRLLAERSGKYAGQIGPEWCGDDGIWKDVWLSDKAPVAARVGVLRKDFTQPTWGVAKYKSYAQTKKDGAPTTMWQKMPDVMLAKCAESLALRKAFPAEMSGIYTAEEMQQADGDLPTVAPLNANVVESDPPESSTRTSEQKAAPAEQKITEQQLSSLRKLYTATGMSEPSNIEAMPFQEARQLIQELSEEYKRQRALFDMITRAKQRVQALSMEWDDVKRDALKSTVADNDLIINQVVQINTLIHQYERDTKPMRTAKAS